MDHHVFIFHMNMVIIQYNNLYGTMQWYWIPQYWMITRFIYHGIYKFNSNILQSFKEYHGINNMILLY